MDRNEFDFLPFLNEIVAASQPIAFPLRFLGIGRPAMCCAPIHVPV
jgi:hypothetical protein